MDPFMWGEAERTQYPVPSTQYPRNLKESLPKGRLSFINNSGLITRFSELRLHDFAALQALRADAHTLAAGADFGPDGAKVNVPAPLSHVVGVADVVSRLRLLAADRADLCHRISYLKVKLRRTYRNGELRSVVCKR